MPTGVKILLAHGASVRWWIRENEKVIVRKEYVAGKQIRCVLIEGGEAEFIPGGSVSVVRLPGYRGNQNRVAFTEGEVLEIRDFDDRLIKRNHYCCPKCFALTGEVAKHSPSQTAGREDAMMGCLDCGENWSVLL